MSQEYKFKCVKADKTAIHRQHPTRQMGSTNPEGDIELRALLLFWDSEFPFFNVAIKLFIFKLFK